MTSTDRRCFKIDSICGYSIARCVVFVGIATMIISFVTMVVAYGSIKSRVNESSYNTKPLIAMNMIFSFTCMSVSIYQFIISSFLVFNKKSYICSLWFVSHLSILTLYLILFSARTIVSIREEQYGAVAVTVTTCVFYEGILIFFMIIIHSYMRLSENSLTSIFY